MSKCKFKPSLTGWESLNEIRKSQKGSGKKGSAIDELCSTETSKKLRGSLSYKFSLLNGDANVEARWKKFKYTVYCGGSLGIREGQVQRTINSR